MVTNCIEDLAKEPLRKCVLEVLEVCCRVSFLSELDDIARRKGRTKIAGPETNFAVSQHCRPGVVCSVSPIAIVDKTYLHRTYVNNGHKVMYANDKLTEILGLSDSRSNEPVAA